MIGPSLASKGGISSVCIEYQKAGLFDRLNIQFLPSYVDAGAPKKLAVAAGSAIRLIGLLCRREVALIHVHMASGSSVWRKLVFCALARIAGVPYIIHLHSGKFPEYFDDRCGSFGRKLIRWGFNSSACLLVLTRERRNWLDQRGLTARPVRELPNMVAIPSGTSKAQRSACLLFLGRLEEEKGLSVLISAFAEVVQSFPNARLLIGGEGDLPRYSEQVASLGLAGAVEFLGWVDGSKKAQLLEQAALFVLPSRYEGLPMGVLEAMSYAVPCVATDVGGLPEIIDSGVNGLLVKVGDVEGLSTAIARLLGDADFRQRLGLEARQTAIDKYSTQAVEKLLAGTYCSACAGK